MPGENEYPPQFAESSISATIGQINDFAGAETSTRSAFAAPNADAQKAFAAAGGSAIPVVITGSRPGSGANFPGLRETMIGAAIYRLAEQIPADNRYRQQLLDAALQLHYSGGDKIVRQRSAGGKPRKKG
jgi:hypothetical protein